MRRRWPLTTCIVLDGLALFFKRFFLLAALLVMLMAVEFSDQFHSGISEFYSLTLFALLGMLFAASAGDFALLFVSLELITITFYVLNSFQRGRVASLEAGVKYLVIGALSTGFTVFGIAFVYGMTRHFQFRQPGPDRRLPAPATRSSCLACSWCWSGSGSRSPRSRSRFGRRMFTRGRPHRPPHSWRWVPRRPVLSCCSGSCSPPFPRSQPSGPTF